MASSVCSLIISSGYRAALPEGLRLVSSLHHAHLSLDWGFLSICPNCRLFQYQDLCIFLCKYSKCFFSKIHAFNIPTNINWSPTVWTINETGKIEKRSPHLLAALSSLKESREQSWEKRNKTNQVQLWRLLWRYSVMTIVNSTVFCTCSLLRK